MLHGDRIILKPGFRPCLSDGESGRPVSEGKHSPRDRPFQPGKGRGRGQQVAERSCHGVAVSNEIPVFHLVRA
ncbi:MAG: hypothetical protein U0N13_06525 [Parabacteroides johnsonii]